MLERDITGLCDMCVYQLTKTKYWYILYLHIPSKNIWVIYIKQSTCHVGTFVYQWLETKPLVHNNVKQPDIFHILCYFETELISTL